MSRRRLKRERLRKQKAVGIRCGQTRKVRFATYDLAIAAASRILSKPDCNAIGFRAYPCHWCGGHHLTSQV